VVLAKVAVAALIEVTPVLLMIIRRSFDPPSMNPVVTVPAVTPVMV